ncbi:MAG: heme ABC exporter ATP-binding protein CcmA [Pseudomonadota bacterium]
MVETPAVAFAGRALACRRSERLVFQGLDFKLEAGQALAVVGPNGSGKSSLLRLMAGLARPEAGALTWGGEALDPEAHRARLHYVGHLDGLKAALSVAENLAFHVSLRGRRPRPAAIEAALEAVGLAGLAALPCRVLSQGQQRRAALARLLAVEAPLWLLDEPTAALDAWAVERMKAALQHHLAAGGSAVVATHHASEFGAGAILDLARIPAVA